MAQSLRSIKALTKQKMPTVIMTIISNMSIVGFGSESINLKLGLENWRIKRYAR